MKIHKRTALGLSAALAAGSLAALTLGVSPAQAATGSTAGLNGSPTNKIGAVAYGATETVTVTAIQSGANVDVAASVGGGSLNPVSPATGGTYRLDALLRVDGTGNTRGATHLIGTVGADDVEVGDQYYPAGTSWNTTVTGLAAGSHSFTLTDLILDSNGATSGSSFAATPANYTGFDSWFNRGTTTTNIVDGVGDYAPVGPTETLAVAGPTASITAVQIGYPTGDAVPLTSPQTLKGGEHIAIQGNNLWAAGNNNVYLRMCTPGGYPTACSPLGVSSTIAPVVGTDTTGGVLGTIRGPLIDSSGFGTGPIDLVVVQTATPMGAVVNTATIPINYSPKSVAPATVSGPAVVSPGASAPITGTNWYPGETVAVNAGTSGPVNLVADASGNISGSLVVNDTAATSFDAAGIGQTASSAFTISADSCTAYVGDLTGGPGCDTSQTILAEVTAGNLSQAADTTGINPNATTVDLGTTQTSVTGSTLTGDLNSITVTDNRGGLYGWSLTANIDGPLTAGSYTIDEANLSGTAACAATAAGSATGVTTGGNQSYDSAVNLCTKDTTADSAGDTTGGVYEASQPLSLDVPAFQAAGNYSAIVTITLL